MLHAVIVVQTSVLAASIIGLRAMLMRQQMLQPFRRLQAQVAPKLDLVLNEATSTGRGWREMRAAAGTA